MSSEHPERFPPTECYKIHSQNSYGLSIIVFLLFMVIFMFFNIIFVGIILGAIVAFTMQYLQKLNNPGLFKHYYHYVKTPNVLSGNKYKE